MHVSFVRWEWIALMRLRQWTKNFAVLAALVFSQRLFDPASLTTSLLAFAAFCLASSATYVVNDILDREADRKHPVKAKRPVASGAISVSAAAWIGAAALAGALGLGVWGGPRLLISLGAYLAVQVGYNLVFKHVAALDVFALAAGFVIRVSAGAWVLGVEASPWIVVCTMNLALFLALAKRRHELTSLEEGAGEHRKALMCYSPHLLDQMIAIAASATVVTYALYTLADQTVEKFGSTRLVWTLPFVVFGVFRYLYLVHRKNLGGSPEWVLLTDAPILATVALWALAAAAIVYG